MSALQHLSQIDWEAKCRKWPSVPPFAVPRTKFKDKTANNLTTAIVRCIELYGGFATRLASTGTYRTDLQRYIPSQQRNGMPDVFGIIEGVPLFIEVKMPSDRLSDDQKEVIAELKECGGLVFIAHNFQYFFDWLSIDVETYIVNRKLAGEVAVPDVDQ